jgi:hypothetical protein
MHDVSFWLPIVLSGAGATVSFFTMICVAIIGWLVKYVLSSTDRRIVSLEGKTESHANHIATQTTQTVAEQKALEDLRGDIGEMRTRFETLSPQIATLPGTMTERKRPGTRP